MISGPAIALFPMSLRAIYGTSVRLVSGWKEARSGNGSPAHDRTS